MNARVRWMWLKTMTPTFTTVKHAEPSFTETKTSID